MERYAGKILYLMIVATIRMVIRERYKGTIMVPIIITTIHMVIRGCIPVSRTPFFPGQERVACVGSCSY